jgi:hypothetical protein
MAAETQSFIKIDECIYSYMDAAELSNHKYFKLWNIAFRGIQDMGLDFFYQVKSLKLPINPNKTVNLPEDYLNYSKIGVLNSKGEVIPLFKNQKLTTFADLSQDRVAKTQDGSLFDYADPNSPIFFNYWNGNSIGNLYGLPSGTVVGEFKVDEHNGIILLSEDFSYDYIILEYVASPKEGADYMIPIQFKEALIEWIGWQDIKHLPASRKGSLGDKRDRRHDYFEARRRAVAKYKPFYLDEAYQQNLQSTRLTIKS